MVQRIDKKMHVVGEHNPSHEVKWRFGTGGGDCLPKQVKIL